MTESAALSAESPPADRTRGLFHHRDFRRLWIGDAVSQLGSQVSFLALPLVAVNTLHATAFEVGALTACETAAFLLVGLPAGAWCDRVRRRPILIAADIGRALTLGSVPVAALMHKLTIAQLFVVALLTGVLTVFFDVAYQSYLPELVSNDQLVDGNGKLEATRAVSQIAGPSLGGFLVQALKAPYAVAADALSFLWSAAWVTAIRAREPEPAKPEQRNLGKEIGEGLRFVLGHPILRKIAGCTGSFNLCSSATFALEILFLVRFVHLSPGGIGLLFSVGSVGALLGALTSGRISNVARAGPHDLGRGGGRRPCRAVAPADASRLAARIDRPRHLRRLVRHGRLQRGAGELPARHHTASAARANERDDAIPGVGHDAPRWACSAAGWGPSSASATRSGSPQARSCSPRSG